MIKRVCDICEKEDTVFYKLIPQINHISLDSIMEQARYGENWGTGYDYDIEIIGDIYTTPELMEVGNE